MIGEMPETQASVFILFLFIFFPWIFFLEKEIITELFITEKWIEIEIMHGFYIYIFVHIYLSIYKKLISFHLDLDGGKLGRHLGFQWQAILVAPRQVCPKISQNSAELGILWKSS